MIIEALCSALVALGTGIIKLLPQVVAPMVGFEQAVSIMSYALWFFPIDLWIIAIGNIAFWIVTSFSWSLIEWIYKKIPGVS